MWLSRFGSFALLLLLPLALSAQTPDSLSITACAAEGCGTAWMHLLPADSAISDDYSATSPHWSHVSTMMTDFYYGWTPTERAWAAAHYDFEMSGDGSAWRALNPAVQTYPYTLLWTTLIPSATATPNITGTITEDMRAWYAAHPEYVMERAFLHDTGAVPADSAHRYTVPIWDSRRWFFDPADSGFAAYTLDRYRRVVAPSSGAFIDESGTGDMNRVAGSREYPSAAPYFTAYATLLAAVKGAIAPKRLIINTSAYAVAADSADAVAAGAVHLEAMNNPLHSGLTSNWAWVDRLDSAGVWVDFVSAYGPMDMVKLAPKFPGYEADSIAAFHRLRMAQLASYYMVVPSDPTRVALQLENTWDRPYSGLWLPAQEVDIGHPTEPRHQLTGLPATDAQGNGVVVWMRRFTKGLIVDRTQTGWTTLSYGDSTAVTVPLPAGTWRPVAWDGSLGAGVSSVRLRNSEAAILVGP